METAGIKLNISKCQIGLQEVKFLGHAVNAEGYRPDPVNVEAVRRMKPPSNIKEFRRFLGMAGFYRKHIEKLSNIASPLSDLTQKGKTFMWTSDCQHAFETLKVKLTTAPILAKANVHKPFVLETDASQHHVAEVLMQYDDNR